MSRSVSDSRKCSRHDRDLFRVCCCILRDRDLGLFRVPDRDKSWDAAGTEAAESSWVVGVGAVKVGRVAVPKVTDRGCIAAVLLLLVAAELLIGFFCIFLGWAPVHREICGLWCYCSAL